MDTTPLNTAKGNGYFVCITFGIIWHSWMAIRTASQMREQGGLRRVEMQFLSLNLSLAFLLVIFVTGVGNWLHIDWLRCGSFFIFVAAFSLAAWAITFHHVFNARQIFLSLAQRIVLVLSAGVGISAGWQLFATFLPWPADFLLSLGLGGAAGLWLDRKSNEWLRLGNDHAIAELRRATIALARTEPDAERLICAFEQLLRTHCGAASASLIFDWDEIQPSERLTLSKDRPAYATLCELGWATPESLERVRASHNMTDLKKFLTERSLGLIVTAPRGSLSPSLFVELGTKASRWPFTYPEVQCVQNVVELMDNILTRSRLTEQAALQAKMEHLAMMSRGLAHDLKNLITPVSSFLIHSDGKHAPESVEAEVHSAARRSVRIMSDYVREALFFSERLAPRFEQIDLERLFETVREIAAERARSRGIALVLRSALGEPVVGDTVLLQRMLANLINNAIDASSPGKCVTVTAERARPGWFQLHVIDEGSGIAPEHLGRIFDPYFTTKEYGDDVRGFGLGLTISKKIADLHGGTITAHSRLGEGTTFTVELPTAQPTAVTPALNTAVGTAVS